MDNKTPPFTCHRMDIRRTTPRPTKRTSWACAAFIVAAYALATVLVLRMFLPII